MILCSLILGEVIDNINLSLPLAGSYSVQCVGLTSLIYSAPVIFLVKERRLCHIIVFNDIDSQDFFNINLESGYFV